MSKSKKFSVDSNFDVEGKNYKYSLEFKGNKIVGVNQHLGNSVEPLSPYASNLYSDVIESDNALKAFNVNKFKWNKTGYQTVTEESSMEEKVQYYDEKTKKVNNEEKEISPQ